MPITYDNYGRVISGNANTPRIRRGPNGLEQLDEATLTWRPLNAPQIFGNPTAPTVWPPPAPTLDPIGQPAYWNPTDPSRIPPRAPLGFDPGGTLQPIGQPVYWNPTDPSRLPPGQEHRTPGSFGPGTLPEIGTHPQIVQPRTMDVPPTGTPFLPQKTVQPRTMDVPPTGTPLLPPGLGFADGGLIETPEARWHTLLANSRLHGRQQRMGPQGLEEFDPTTLQWRPVNNDELLHTEDARRQEAALLQAQALQDEDQRRQDATMQAQALQVEDQRRLNQLLQAGAAPGQPSGAKSSVSDVPSPATPLPSGAPAATRPNPVATTPPGSPTVPGATRPAPTAPTAPPAPRPNEFGNPGAGHTLQEESAYQQWYNSLAPSTRAYVHAPGSPGADYANAQFRAYVAQYGAPFGGAGTTAFPGAAPGTTVSGQPVGTQAGTPAGAPPPGPAPAATRPPPTASGYPINLGASPGIQTGSGGGSGTGRPPEFGGADPYADYPTISGAKNGLGFADGGPIKGPGGPRDDNLVIRASNGEYVMPADVVRRKGTEFFERLTDKTREDSGANVTGVHGFADGGYIDESAGLNMDPLPASASPGLDVLPAQGGASPDLSAFDPGGAEPPMGATAQPPPAAPQPVAAGSGLGLATFKAARSNDDQEYLKNLPMLQKVGLALESFGAGVNGQGSPIERLLDNKRKREAEFRAELGTTLQNVKVGVELLKKFPPGKARDALTEQIVRASGASGELVREALHAAGTEGEAQMKELLSVIQHPAAREMLTKYAAAHPDPIKAASEALKDSDFMKRLEQRVDQAELPAITAKMQLMSRAMEKMPQFKDANGSVSFTMADLRTQNAALPKEYQLTEADLGTINRNQPSLIPFGLRTDKTQQDEQSATAKRKEEGPMSEIAKLNADHQAGRITPAQWQQGLRKALIPNEKQDAKNAPAPEGSAMSPEAIDMAAGRYAIDGTLPPNLGRGTQGAALTAKIVNRAAQMAADSGDTAEAARIRQLANRASGQALVQLTKQETMVGSFEKNAIKNADIALDLSAKTGRTGSPVLNKWILAGQKEIAGDADVAAFNASVQTFVNEYAKIMSGSMGNTATSDSLRKETMTMLATKDTDEQFQAVVKLMKREMGNRMQGFKDQKAELTGGMKSKPKADTAAPAPAAAAASGDVASQAKAAFGSYEPDKYEYGVNPATGKFARRPKT